MCSFILNSFFSLTLYQLCGDIDTEVQQISFQNVRLDKHLIIQYRSSSTYVCNWAQHYSYKLWRSLSRSACDQAWFYDLFLLMVIKQSHCTQWFGFFYWKLETNREHKDPTVRSKTYASNWFFLGEFWNVSPDWLPWSEELVILWWLSTLGHISAG